MVSPTPTLWRTPFIICTTRQIPMPHPYAHGCARLAKWTRRQAFPSYISQFKRTVYPLHSPRLHISSIWMQAFLEARPLHFSRNKLHFHKILFFHNQNEKGVVPYPKPVLHRHLSAGRVVWKDYGRVSPGGKHFTRNVVSLFKRSTETCIQVFQINGREFLLFSLVS